MRPSPLSRALEYAAPAAAATLGAAVVALDALGGGGARADAPPIAPDRMGPSPAGWVARTSSTPLPAVGRPPATPQLRTHPVTTAALSPGQLIADPLPASALEPVSGRWTGPPLVVHDNPESFTSPGVLGSTIAPVPGRGDGTYALPGGARVFTLANNRTSRTQVYSAVVKNNSSTRLQLEYAGTIYSKKVTAVDGRIPADYAPSGFRGPHAIAAHSELTAAPGKNGYLRGKLDIGPGQTAVVSSARMAAGGEVFSSLELRARDPGQTFGVASVVSPKPLGAGDLERLGRGDYPAAGGGFAPAGPNALGRPNGVVPVGSTFEAQRTVSLQPGQRFGELFFATRFKGVAPRPDLAVIRPALPNPAGVGPAAETSDGSYGARYRFRYQLENPADQPLRVEVGLTAPSSGEGRHRPLGGELTMPVKVDGRVVGVRVDARGEGRVLTVVEVPPRGRRAVELELVHVGNTFPPAAIELRAR